MDRVSINVDISAAITVAVTAQVDTTTASAKNEAGCSVGKAPRGNGGAWATAVVLAGVMLLRRRRQSRTAAERNPQEHPAARVGEN
jgi:MYXO-CTERM domain-containing protein